MLYHILAIGDVTSEDGLKHLRRHLSPLKKLKSIDFTVVNGENISGTGLTPAQADELFAAGADVITLATTPLAGCRSPTIWRTTATSCGPPTSPAGCRVAAAACMTAASCASPS